MKKIYLFLFCFSYCHYSTAQIKSFLDKEEPGGVADTIYYKYYDGIQMIEIDYFSPWNKKVNWLELTHPRGAEWSMVLGSPCSNIYIFRNEKGEIIKQYKKRNSSDIIKGASCVVHSSDLRSPADSDKKSITHQSDFLKDYFYIMEIYGQAYRQINHILHYKNFYGSLVVMDSTGKIGLIDTMGETIMNPDFDFILLMDSYYIYGKDNLYGLMSPDHKEIIKPYYDRISPSYYTKGFLNVVKNNKHGIIDSTGKEIVSCIYDVGIWEFVNGYANVISNNKTGFINIYGKEICPPKYAGTGKFSEGMVWVTSGYKRGFIDTTGAEVIPLIYEETGNFSDGLVNVRKWNKWGFIDKKGNEVIPFIYDDLRNSFYSDGLARISVRVDFDNYDYYFIDKSGNKVFEWKYYFAGHFSEGMAKVAKEKGEYGFIDTTGQLIIPCKYESAENFKNGKALVTTKNAIYYIDKSGNKIK